MSPQEVFPVLPLPPSPAGALNVSAGDLLGSATANSLSLLAYLPPSRNCEPLEGADHSLIIITFPAPQHAW